jgi:hypothetical protein
MIVFTYLVQATMNVILFQDVFVDGVTSYMMLPTKKPSYGFVVKNNKVVNFFNHDGERYILTTDVNIFLKHIL